MCSLYRGEGGGGRWGGKGVVVGLRNNAMSYRTVGYVRKVVARKM